MDIWYYGARYKKGCHPNDLWTKYFTSSVHAEESKQKMRKPRSEEAKQNMRKPKSEEHKQNIRKSRIGKTHFLEKDYI